MQDKAKTKDICSAKVRRGGGTIEGVKVGGVYEVVCKGPDGKIRWRDTIKNLITTAGLNKLLDETLAGSAYTAAWYIGLISATSYTTGPAAGDTMASHGGWAEDETYSGAARPTTAWSAASSGSKALSAALDYSINGTTTIKGCFLADDSTKGGATGVLYSAGLFTGGDKAVSSGDTLSVSYTATIAAA